MNSKNADVNPQNSLSLIEQALINPDIQPEKLQQLLVVKKDWEADEALKAFNTAMHGAQTDMPVIVKDAENKHTCSKYARLETVAKGIKKVYTAHGFSVSFSEEVCDREGWIQIIMIVRHVGNHVETYKRFAPIDDTGSGGAKTKTKLHGCQSTMSYMQRHLLCATFGVTVADDDNDGNTDDVPPEFITQDQADEIEKYLGNLPAAIRKSVLELCKCETIESIESRWHKTVLGKLKASINQES